MLVKGLESFLVREYFDLLIGKGHVIDFVDVLVIGSQLLWSSCQSNGWAHTPHASLPFHCLSGIESLDVWLPHEFLEVLNLLPKGSLVSPSVHDLT